MHRAWFSLSRALFRKKMWGVLTLGNRPFFSLKKTGDLFLVITICKLSVLQCHPYLFSPKKTDDLFWSSLSLFYFTRSFECRPLFPRMLLCCKKFAASLVQGPMFGRTCLNPPLFVQLVKEWFNDLWTVMLAVICTSMFLTDHALILFQRKVFV